LKAYEFVTSIVVRQLNKGVLQSDKLLQKYTHI